MGTCSTKVHILQPPTIASYAKGAGVTGYNLVIALAIALAESGGNQYAMDCDSNGSVDYGLWQINSVHGYDSQRLLDDPSYNAAAMYNVSGGGKTWTPWVTYNNGAYKSFLGTAQVYSKSESVAPQMGGAPGGGAKGKGESEKEAQNIERGGIPSLSGFLAPFEAIAKPFEWLSNSHNWIRIIEVIAGGVLLAIAVKELFHIEPTPVPIPV